MLRRVRNCRFIIIIIINTKKKEILPIIIAGIIRFLSLVNGLKFGNAKIFFVYKIHTLILYFVCT